MPTYDYQCKACGHEFEHFQQMTAPLLRKCPKCGKAKLERLIGTGAGVLFKGGGFYETDYRSDSYTKAAEAEKKSAEAKPESPKSSETTAPSKSDSPSDAKALNNDKGATAPAARDSRTSQRTNVKSSTARGAAKRSRRK